MGKAGKPAQTPVEVSHQHYCAAPQPLCRIQPESMFLFIACCRCGVPELLANLHSKTAEKPICDCQLTEKQWPQNYRKTARKMIEKDAKDAPSRTRRQSTDPRGQHDPVAAAAVDASARLLGTCIRRYPSPRTPVEKQEKRKNGRNTGKYGGNTGKNRGKRGKTVENWGGTMEWDILKCFQMHGNGLHTTCDTFGANNRAREGEMSTTV